MFFQRVEYILKANSLEVFKWMTYFRNWPWPSGSDRIVFKWELLRSFRKLKSFKNQKKKLFFFTFFKNERKIFVCYIFQNRKKDFICYIFQNRIKCYFVCDIYSKQKKMFYFCDILKRLNSSNVINIQYVGFTIIIHKSE